MFIQDIIINIYKSSKILLINQKKTKKIGNEYTLYNIIYCNSSINAFCSLKRLMTDRVDDAVSVLNVNAPPVTVLPHARHFHTPTTCLLILDFPQNGHRYRPRWEFSVFFICFLNDAPYLVPYLPTIPTFFVRRAIILLFIKSQKFIYFF